MSKTTASAVISTKCGFTNGASRTVKIFCAQFPQRSTDKPSIFTTDYPQTAVFRVCFAIPQYMTNTPDCHAHSFSPRHSQRRTTCLLRLCRSFAHILALNLSRQEQSDSYASINQPAPVMIAELLQNITGTRLSHSTHYRLGSRSRYFDFNSSAIRDEWVRFMLA